jgi:hypothetical protein
MAIGRAHPGRELSAPGTVADAHRPRGTRTYWKALFGYSGWAAATVGG